MPRAKLSLAVFKNIPYVYPVSHTAQQIFLTDVTGASHQELGQRSEGRRYLLGKGGESQRIPQEHG